MKRAAILFLWTSCLAVPTKAQFYPRPGSHVVKNGEVRAGLNGDIRKISHVSRINVVYDYSGMQVAQYKSEQEYFAKKEEGFNGNEAEMESFKSEWFGARGELYEPQFEEHFNKSAKATGITATNYTQNSEITLKVKTLRTDPGFNVGVAKQPTSLDVDCIFLNASGEVVLYCALENVSGSVSGYKTGPRLAQSYARAAELLGELLEQELKKNGIR